MLRWIKSFLDLFGTLRIVSFENNIFHIISIFGDFQNYSLAIVYAVGDLSGLKALSKSNFWGMLVVFYRK